MPLLQAVMLATSEERRNMNAAGLGVAAVALVISIVSFILNRSAAERAERHGRMPILVPESPIGPERIAIRNIGNGPALNIAIRDALDNLASTDALEIDLSDSRYRSMWGAPRHLEPIEPGGKREYPWAWSGAVGLTYTDALGAWYTTLTSSNGTKITDGNPVPRTPLNAMQYPT
jgi:hypothetical protein